jgi:hypothetical protein
MLVLTFLSQNVISQTLWNENFSDSNFTANPVWTGDTALFSISTSKELQLDAPAASGTASLATQSTCGLDATWQFRVRLAFNPSTSNYAKVYLVSTSANLNASLNGYYVRLGGSTEDRISLFRQSGTASVLLAESPAAMLGQTTINVNIRVTRNVAHQWVVEADTTGAASFTAVAMAIDSTHKTSTYFGWQCIYTSTRSKAFFLDDISASGKAFVDNVKPNITSATFPDQYTIRLQFSEPVDSVSATKTGNYIITQSNTTAQTVLFSRLMPAEVQLTFATALDALGPFNLRCEGVEDLFGNEMNDTIMPLEAFFPQYRNVIFSEIMADPSPMVGLPGAEYIELYNATAYPINLEGWVFSAGADNFTLPGYTLPFNSFVLLVAQSVANLFDTLPHIAIPASTSYLGNSGEALVLRDAKGAVMDAITYSISWHSNPAKTEGGWSLENRAMISQCVDYTSWSSSKAIQGGTPGMGNFPEKLWTQGDCRLAEVRWQSPTELVFLFDQGLSKIHPPVFECTLPIAEMEFDELKPYEMLVRFSQPISSQPITVRLVANQSCEGNYVADTILLTAPQPTQAGDVVLNELLFNPAGEVQDFVEIWNTSQKTILLGDVRLANLDEIGNPTSLFALGHDSTVLLPGQFLVVTADAASLCEKYNCPKLRFFSETATPSMPDAGAHIALVRPNLAVLESVNFSDDWHNPLISNPEMVSLERVNPNLNSAEKSSWHSASTQSGYATPGHINSQFLSSESQQANFWLSTETLSPNNDGFNDLVMINYDLPQGSLLTLQVFSLNGIAQKMLADNELAEPNGTLLWDGTTTSGNVAATGIYIIFATWFTPDGQTGNAKLNIAVSR